MPEFLPKPATPKCLGFKAVIHDAWPDGGYCILLTGAFKNVIAQRSPQYPTFLPLDLDRGL